MIETKTDATVTKLNKRPTNFFQSEKGSVNNNTVKTMGSLKETQNTKDSDQSTSIDVISKNKKIKKPLNRKRRKRIEISSEAVLKFAFAMSLAVVCAAICFSTCSFGYRVTLSNKNIGSIPTKSMFEDTVNSIADDVFKITGQEFELVKKPSLSLGITLNRNMLSRAELTEKIKAESEMMISSYAVLIDGEMVVALPSEDMAKSTIEEYKNAFSGDSEQAKVNFANDVKISYMLVPKQILHTKDAAVNLLLGGEFSYYKSEKQQTVSELSQKTGIEEEKITETNNLKDDIIKKDQVLKLYSGRMFADVMSVERIQRKVAIDFETVKKDSNEVYKGKTKIEKTGEEGLKEVSECITYINGVETKRDVLDENIIKAPTVQIELVGTKELPSSVGTGRLAVPTSGEISSRYGSRWGRQHQGIDLSASVGTPIYAADNGTVTYSEFNNGGYGYMIKIDHGNGIETYYAHCSELIAKSGEVVGKGDLIAKVGNTGRSTGPHLHFEVRKDGSPIDPLNYIN